MANEYGSILNCEHYQFINNVFGSMFRGFADFFKTEMFPRSQKIVIGTYAKAVEHYRNKINRAGEKQGSRYPFISMDPRLDFEPVDQGGRFFHGYPNFMRRFASGLYKPEIYSDENITISPVLNRYRGSIELIIWCSSVYETIDYRTWTYQFFGGLGRPIQPKIINAFYILPDEFYYFTYSNPYTQQTYQLDWTNESIETTLIKNINQDKFVFPFDLLPRISLTSVSDGTEKYGSGDSLGEHRLDIELEWECSLPTHVILLSENFPQYERFIFEIETGAQYVKSLENTSVQPSYTPASFIGIGVPTDTTSVTMVDLTFDQAYNYILTSEDSTKLSNDEDVVITLLDPLPNIKYVKVYGKYGEMTQGNHFRATTTSITLIGFAISSLDEGDIISIK